MFLIEPIPAKMKTNSHIQIALLSIHIILILIAIMLKSKIYFPKVSLYAPLRFV